MQWWSLLYHRWKRCSLYVLSYLFLIYRYMYVDSNSIGIDCGSFTTIQPYDGTPCGSTKQCYNGTCQASISLYVVAFTSFVLRLLHIYN
jgi:hypothetical protein